MKGKLLWMVLMTSLIAIIAGCSGGSDSTPAPPVITNPNVAAYPTAADSFEGAGGDNSVATAATAAVGTAQNRTIYPVGDLDYIKVNLIGGIEYEFSANHLSVNSDTYMELYESDGTTLIDSNDDSGDVYPGIAYDSAIRYTPAVDKTVYVLVETLDAPYGVLRYTFSAHPLVDVDGDNYSTYYDCNDADASIAPWEIDIPGDGIDQDCSGADVIADGVADGSETDNSPAQAKTLMAADHFVGEVNFMGDIERANMRTIFPVDDVDWFKVIVPAYSAVEFDFGNANYANTVGWMDDGLTFEPTYEAYTAEILTNPAAPAVTSSFYENTTATAETLYLQYQDSGNLDPTGVYIPVVWSHGTDMDGDSFYTKRWAFNYDCNDNDASIYTGAVEVAPDDGIDQDCNGADN